ncbi:DHA1 family bicyclomycin/chloramphenicol resistance-like MFS transporter [Rhodovulum imhoffii]|uniref:Bcr/CflA family efflux transporter n=1 Tax=Rhodovulum imhoffii TaxID=365340 RepID=A0A2T5BW56_9RHOB|nr:multidrug effflux MFS transporter [Rhodovulum imhoffii]MBK5935165.1 Bcr/CflA family drug resistance efflux transporter [Rhodovulum imhoffii]PTN03867.1 DHA1 family bicyclomycin/chloramphenicol resistance-like MFS transporter [Rhodovulum imhoffii]
MPEKPTVRLFDRTTPPHIVTLVLLSGLAALSLNIFLPSLPAMTAYFATEYRVMQLSVALYLATNAALQLVIGPISDRYGRRPVLLWAIMGFLLATLGCLLAPTVEVFLLFRMAQSVIVAGMVLSRAAVRDMVDEAQAASMLGYVTMGMAMVPMIGPAIGGVLDEAFGWKANFAMLLILGGMVLAICWADMGETSSTTGRSLRAQIREYPELFSSRRFWGYVLAASCASGVFFAFLGGAPFVGTQVYGLSPSQLGLYFGLTALGYMGGNFLSGRYSVRVGLNLMMLGGTALTTAGLALALGLALAGATHPLTFFGLMITVGVGNGMLLPNATSGMLSVRPHLAGTASGLGGAIMIAGGAGLSALAGALLGPGSDAVPLLLLMLASSAASVLAALYVMHVTRVKGPLPGPS